MSPDERKVKQKAASDKYRQSEKGKTFQRIWGKSREAAQGWYDTRLRAKEAVMNVYTNGRQQCSWCPQCDLDVLCLDHINDDGMVHRTELQSQGYGKGAGERLYRWCILHDYPPIFQVLCGSCNMKKEAQRRRNKWLGRPTFKELQAIG